MMCLLSPAHLGNAESLKEASLHLGDVDRQFTRIVNFWENMAATLKYLKDNVKSGEVYLKKIENPNYADRFKKSIGRAERVLLIDALLIYVPYRSNLIPVGSVTGTTLYADLKSSMNKEIIRYHFKKKI